MTSRGTKRRIVLVALLAALSLIVAACGDDDEENPPAGNGGAEENFDLVKDGHLVIGSDIPYPPFEFEDDSGALTGFDVELVREIADRLGLANEDDDWQSVDFGTIFDLLRAGNKFDIVVAAVTAYAPEGSPAAETVAERRQKVDFSVAYYPSLQSLAVNTEENPDIKSIDDLGDGDRIAVQTATTGGFFAKEMLEPKGVSLVEFGKAPLMYQALQAGQVLGVFNDLPVSLDALEGKEPLAVVQQVETGEQYAIAVSKDNPELLQAIDDALQEMFDDGTYASIFTKYFPDQTLPDYASE